MHGYDQRLNDQWEMTRYNGYLTYCTVTPENERKNIYDFFPLPGDPPREEQAKHIMTSKDAMIQRFIDRGHLKPGPARKAAMEAAKR